MLLNIEKHWYQKKITWLTALLLPFSLLFFLIIQLRRLSYRIGIKKTFQFNIPIIVVGNITVGGTGKTPFVIWLVNILKKQGFKPGIVSRGAGGQAQNQIQFVSGHSDPKIVGDEALLLAKRSGCPIVIGKDRVAAVQKLLAETDCNIVISDDGLQHYRLGRSMEIALIDLERQYGNGLLLPAGPLRERPNRLKQVDCIIYHGKTGNMQLHGESIISLHDQAIVSLKSLSHKTVHALAAIGNPQRFFSTLREFNIDVVEHIFPDHYHYEARDLNFPADACIIMTEKDAVKFNETLIDHRFWYLPVEARVHNDIEEIILKKLKEAL